MNTHNSDQIKVYTISFIYILFISMSIYPAGSALIKPPDLLIPFLVILALSNFRNIKNIIFIGILLITYIFLVDIVNNGPTGALVTGGRMWIYAVLFVALAKIFASIDFVKYEKTIMHAIYLSLGIIIMIYVSLYLRISIAERFFSSNPEYSGELQRIAGVSTYVLMTYLVISYIHNLKSKFNLILLSTVVLLFVFAQSRTMLLTFLILYIILFFSKKALIVLIGTAFFTLSSVLVALEELMKTEYRFMASRLAEMIYFWKSHSMYVRLNDSKYFVENWLSDWPSFFIGHGLSFKLNVPRYNYTYDPFTGKLNIIYNQMHMAMFHRSDNLIIELIVDGGLCLLIFMIALYVYACTKIYKKDKRLGMAFLFMVIMNAFSTVHLVTNFTLVFFIAYIYYGTIYMKQNRG